MRFEQQMQWIPGSPPLLRTYLINREPGYEAMRDEAMRDDAPVSFISIEVEINWLALTQSYLCYMKQLILKTYICKCFEVYDLTTSSGNFRYIIGLMSFTLQYFVGGQ